MGFTLNLRKKSGRISFGRKELIVIISSIILTTVGIKATDTLMNSRGGQTADSGCPDGMTEILSSDGNFCIDVYEVSAGQGCPYTDPNNQAETRENLNIGACQPASIKGVMPWRNISQNQAASACAKAGKRLPTGKEWQAAALGTPDKSADWSAEDCQVAKNWVSQPGASGSGERCKSSAGAYDMVGNVWEWVQGSVYNGEFDSKALPKQGYISGLDEVAMPISTAETPDENYFEDYLWIKTSGTRGIARGGYWDNDSEAGAYSAYIVNEPSFAGIGIGFRCVK